MELFPQLLVKPGMLSIGTLINVLLLVIVAGVIWWAVNRILGVLPIEEPFRTIAYVVMVLIVVFICFYILQMLLGGMIHLPSISIR